MKPHFHSGVYAFLFAGVSAVVFLNLVRFGAAKMVDYAPTETLGKSIGALVTF